MFYCPPKNSALPDSPPGGVMVARAFFRLVPVALLALAAASCVSEDETAPVLDASFVGYSDPTTGQTVCGNCHIDRQRSWSATKHAHAWATLENTGTTDTSCAKCHT